MINNPKTIHAITKSYVMLLLIFGGVLIAGTIKSTVYPDEQVYVPGRYIAIYNPISQEFFDPQKKTAFSKINFDQLTANSFQPQSSQPANCQ